MITVCGTDRGKTPLRKFFLALQPDVINRPHSVPNGQRIGVCARPMQKNRGDGHDVTNDEMHGVRSGVPPTYSDHRSS